MLTQEDFQNLLAVVRAATPSTFTGGKSLVILEGKIMQVLQGLAKAQMDVAVAEAVAAQTSEDQDV